VLVGYEVPAVAGAAVSVRPIASVPSACVGVVFPAFDVDFFVTGPGCDYGGEVAVEARAEADGPAVDDRHSCDDRSSAFLGGERSQSYETCTTETDGESLTRSCHSESRVNAYSDWVEGYGRDGSTTIALTGSGLRRDYEYSDNTGSGATTTSDEISFDEEGVHRRYELWISGGINDGYTSTDETTVGPDGYRHSFTDSTGTTSECSVGPNEPVPDDDDDCDRLPQLDQATVLP
jgi:hypothetical protein